MAVKLQIPEILIQKILYKPKIHQGNILKYVSQRRTKFFKM